MKLFPNNGASVTLFDNGIQMYLYVLNAAYFLIFIC